MVNIINKILFYLKIVLLMIAFSLTLYILFIKEDRLGNQVLLMIRVIIPLFLVVVIFVVSFFYKEGNSNTLFNISCFLALLSIVIIDYRTIMDIDMVMWSKYSINFYYFENQVLQIKIFCYLMFLGNLLLIYKERIENNNLKFFGIK